MPGPAAAAASLTPWPGTAAALGALAAAGLRLGALSNGDRATLVNATAALLPGVPFWRVFPSDYPVGAFKPQAAMYELVALAVAAEGWPPEAVLHAAGSAVDAQGARQYGLLSVFISHGSPVDGPPSPCAVLENTTLLPAYLNVSQYPPSASPAPSAAASASAAAGAAPGLSAGGAVAVAAGAAAGGALAVLLVQRQLAARRERGRATRTPAAASGGRASAKAAAAAAARAA